MYNITGVVFHELPFRTVTGRKLQWRQPKTDRLHEQPAKKVTLADARQVSSVTARDSTSDKVGRTLTCPSHPVASLLQGIPTE